MLSCHISTPANFLHLQISKEVQKRNVNVLLLVSSQLGVNQPTHAGLGCHSNRFEIHLLVLSPTQTHTCMHTLSFLRDEVSQAAKVPFPSISGRPQRSAIGETNGAGPISCLVPFESAKLLRTSKKISQFIWDLLALFVTHMRKSPTHEP